MLNGCCLLSGAEFYVAVDNKGLWPNLTLLPNGEIVAAVYNHPSHGFGCGNVELWASVDEGRLWTFRSLVSDHSEDPELTRMNHAIGLNAGGELVALISGFSKGRKLPTLPIQICISKDNGETWERHESDIKDYPFGSIVLSPDGTLSCAINRESKESWVYSSKDNGVTWEDKGLVSTDGNETALLRCRNGKWFAAVRTWGAEKIQSIFENNGLELFTSTDEEPTWRNKQSISLPCQVPGDLLELDNGDILLSYGSRFSGLWGVVMRLSKDGGKTWSEPRTLISIPQRTDCGYPSSIQLKDGTILTAYYFGPKYGFNPAPNALPWHWRYHMGIARWQPKNFITNQGK